MKASDKVRAVLAVSGRKQTELAEYLGMSRQNLNTKLTRNSWPTDDMVRVAEFVGAKLGFFMPDGSTIFLDPPEDD